MERRFNVDELPSFDAAAFLDNDQTIAAYLTDVLAANDAGLLVAALDDIARACGMTQVAAPAAPDPAAQSGDSP